jgi:hypothetical protein
MYQFVADQVLGINGFVNLSNIVFFVAFSVRDVLMLRILSLVGGFGPQCCGAQHS